MDENERCVFVAHGLTEANQVQAFLEAAGIPSVLRGEALTKTHGLTVDGLGKLEIIVAESDEEQARALLSSVEAGEFRLDEDADLEAD
jgi:putative signal transducing protein